MYSIEKGLGQPFINSTTDILHELAAVSKDLESVMEEYKRSPNGDLPNIFRHITLSYHHVSSRINSFISFLKACGC